MSSGSNGRSPSSPPGGDSGGRELGARRGVSSVKRDLLTKGLESGPRASRSIEGGGATGVLGEGGERAAAAGLAAAGGEGLLAGGEDFAMDGGVEFVGGDNKADEDGEDTGMEEPDGGEVACTAAVGEGTLPFAGSS